MKNDRCPVKEVVQPHLKNIDSHLEFLSSTLSGLTERVARLENAPAQGIPATENPGKLTAEPQQIDWAKIVGSHVPVWFSGPASRSTVGFLYDWFGEALPFCSGSTWWSHASLDTGLWVPNVDGVCPWPTGVLVGVTLRNGVVSAGPQCVSELDWIFEGTTFDYDIIFSRFAGLQEGWRE